MVRWDMAALPLKCRSRWVEGGDLRGCHYLRHDGSGQYQAQQQDVFSGQHRQQQDGPERHLLPGGLETGLSPGIR